LCSTTTAARCPNYEKWGRFAGKLGMD
jgi:hypothetical protein